MSNDTDDNHEFTTGSSPGEQAFERAVDDTETVRLAQPLESNHDHESVPGPGPEDEAEIGEWLRVSPFRSGGMRRLTLGTIGTGKTVSAMSTASRVLDTVPDARIVVVNPIPGEYDPLADTLPEKNRDSETGDIPSAKRFRVGDGDTLSLSASDLPAVSIIEPPTSSDLPGRQEVLGQAVEDFVGELSVADRQWPTYLILDEAHYIFRSESAFGFDELIQAQQDHGALAVQLLTHTDELGRFEGAMGDGEDVQRPPRLFDTFDLYYTENLTLRKRLGLSLEDAEFVSHEAVPGGESRATVREAAPSGLCKTPDGDWQRVRYTLTDHEAETLLGWSTPTPEDRHENRHQRRREQAGGSYHD